MTADEVAAVDRKSQNGKQHSSLSPVSDGGMKRAHSMSALLLSPPADSNQSNDPDEQMDQENEEEGKNKANYEPVSLQSITFFRSRVREKKSGERGEKEWRERERKSGERGRERKRERVVL